MPEVFVYLYTAFAALLLLLGAAVLCLDLHLYLRPIPSDIDTAVREQLEAAKLPGAAIAVIQEHQVVFARGYGWANTEEKRPVTPDSIFQIASVSKLVTAAALMLLHEQGCFRLDEDINAYLPFKVRNPKFPGAAITFRMLLTHNSSITDGPGYEASYTLGQSAESPVPLGDFLRRYFTLGRDIYSTRRNFTSNRPGSAYSYSNVGFGLAGFLVEQISGQPFDRFCSRRIFLPLGMDSTTWFHAGVDPSRWAMPYHYSILSRSYCPVGAYSFATYPDGSLKTSVNDFLRFIAPFINEGLTLNGQPFLKPETVAEMLRVQYPESRQKSGLAWAISQTSAKHSGGDPGVSTLAVINPARKRGLVIFTNGGGTETPGALRSTLGFHKFAKLVSIMLRDQP